jgi:signal transduction histidine kinase
MHVSPEREGRVTIEVEDRGVGLNADQIARVFDPYFTTKRTGTGLGLAIARNLVEALGGSITVESEEGRGTTMRLEIPTRPSEAT